MVKIVTGDLLNATEHLICHQVNCHGVMGAGVAKAIREKWPGVYRDYRKYVEDRIWNKDFPLGSVQYVPIGNDRFIVNMFAQDDYGRSSRATNYEAFYNCLEDIKLSTTSYHSIAFPYGIGCGLGGGSWDVIYAMICDVLSDRDVVIHKLEGKRDD